MFQALSNKYVAGIWSCSASLIDIALWDIKGKETGQPVWKLLGGAHSRVPVYITFGTARYSKEELVEVAKMLVAEGQDKLKMVVRARAGEGVNKYEWANQYEWAYGHVTDEDIIEDAERIKAVREAIGDKVALMIDANRNPSYKQALRLAKLVEPYNLTWFEDPLIRSDPRLMAQLRKETVIPLAAGSTGTSELMHLREYLLHEAVDIIQPNVRDIGGYSGGLKAAALAQAFNVQLAMGGNWPHINTHLHAGVPNGGWVEFHWRAWHEFESLFDGTSSPIKGWVTMPKSPGLGFTPKTGIIQEYAVE
jgi:L-alanine-DL-glutamate epimerase-like enolase superfamily enzyme